MTDAPLEDLVGAEVLAALMDARHAPGNHRGWPAAAAAGRARGLALTATGHAGWNHVARQLRGPGVRVRL